MSTRTVAALAAAMLTFGAPAHADDRDAGWQDLEPFELRQRIRDAARTGTDDRLRCASGDGSERSRTLSVVGLTSDSRLVCFDEHRPGSTRDIGFVSNLAGDTALIGIDFRVQDGKLYGVGNRGGVYVLDTGNAVATKVGALTLTLEGTAFGVDFNPAADRLRIVSDTGQNLRHNVNTGGVTLLDDPLDYPPATGLNAVGPNAPGVTGAAYTNDDLRPETGTTLYVIDSTLDQVAIQSPANDGTLALVGRLGVDVDARVGFDIYSVVRDGVSVHVQGLAAVRRADGVNKLVVINLATGRATDRGPFAPKDSVIDIAVPLRQR